MRGRSGGGALRGAAAALGAVALGLGGGSLALAAHFARRVLTPALRPEARVTVWAVETDADAPGGRLVWIHGPDAALPGVYSFIWADGAGHARLGPVVDRIRDGRLERVARPVLAVDRGELRAGVRGRVTGWWYTDPAELGYETERVAIPVDGGLSWAWLVRPAPDAEQTGRWAVHVHGRGALPEETLRGVAPLARAGVTSLVIAYRNDPGAPPGLRGRYGLGLAERRDADDAISWAIAHGAHRVTLVGWSMGATASVLAATRGPHRSVIDGLVLDSPALDWPSLLMRQARLVGLPAPFARLAMQLLQRGWIRGAVPGRQGTDLQALTAGELARGLRVPVLVHASPEDTFVPWDGSLSFARLQPELVTLREAEGEHVKLWNVDRETWEATTEAFVRALEDPRSGERD
ncbi:MAG: alpha/beta hydrolase family protein [Leucobacter sp.]